MLDLMRIPKVKHRLSVKEFEQIVLRAISDKSCWRFGKYLGSMLFLDFGNKLFVPSVRGGYIDIGESTIGIRDCYWELRKNAENMTDSNLVSGMSAKKLARYIEGATLVRIGAITKSKRIELEFSNSAVLSVDTANQYGTDDPIIEFTRQDGQIYEVSPRGRIYISNLVSTFRSNKERVIVNNPPPQNQCN